MWRGQYSLPTVTPEPPYESRSHPGGPSGVHVIVFVVVRSFFFWVTGCARGQLSNLSEGQLSNLGWVGPSELFSVPYPVLPSRVEYREFDRAALAPLLPRSGSYEVLDVSESMVPAGTKPPPSALVF